MVHTHKKEKKSEKFSKKSLIFLFSHFKTLHMWIVRVCVRVWQIHFIYNLFFFWCCRWINKKLAYNFDFLVSKCVYLCICVCVRVLVYLCMHVVQFGHFFHHHLSMHIRQMPKISSSNWTSYIYTHSRRNDNVVVIF